MESITDLASGKKKRQWPAKVESSVRPAELLYWY